MNAKYIPDRYNTSEREKYKSAACGLTVTIPSPVWTDRMFYLKNDSI